MQSFSDSCVGVGGEKRGRGQKKRSERNLGGRVVQKLARFRLCSETVRVDSGRLENRPPSSQRHGEYDMSERGMQWKRGTDGLT